MTELVLLPAAAAGSTDPWWADLISSALLAAAVAAFVSVYLARRRSRAEELARIRLLMAEALQAVADCKEFPYAIRRRRHDAAAEERVRISDELRQVQARLSYYAAWMRTEDQSLGRSYGKLVAKVREVAGGACRDAWNAEPITTDAEMNIPAELVDLSTITTLEDAFFIDAKNFVRNFNRWWRL